MLYATLDLFAGCGGLGLGFKKNKNFNIKLANDVWKPAMNTYKFNNPEINFILDDIANINNSTIEKYFPEGVSVIIGGPPCQGFSMCGARNIDDERNDLFYEYARIVNMVKPYIFIMENVKGLLSMVNTKGNLVIESIYDEFEKCGYKLKHKVLNTKYYNVPQSRERVILVGVRKDLPNNYDFPQPVLDDEKHFTIKDALYGLPNKDSENGEVDIEDIECNEYYKIIRGSGKIYNHTIPTHKNDVTHRMSLVPQGGNWRNIPEEFRVGGIHSNAYRRLHLDEASVTIKHAYKSMIIHPIYDRCLTIREVARIQSFPDDFIFRDSKTTQYQQLANAVPPNFANILANSVYEYLAKNNIKSNNIIKYTNLEFEKPKKNIQLNFLEDAI